MEFAPEFACNLSEKPQEVDGRVTSTTLTDHRAADDVQGGIQTGQAVSAIVVRLPGGQSRPECKQRLRTI